MKSSLQLWHQIIENNPCLRRIAMGWKVWVSTTGRGKRASFPFSKTSRPAFGLTQPPIQWVPAFFPEGNAAGV